MSSPQSALPLPSVLFQMKPELIRTHQLDWVSVCAYGHSVSETAGACGDMYDSKLWASQNWNAFFKILPEDRLNFRAAKLGVVEVNAWSRLFVLCSACPAGIKHRFLLGDTTIYSIPVFFEMLQYLQNISRNCFSFSACQWGRMMGPCRIYATFTPTRSADCLYDVRRLIRLTPLTTTLPVWRTHLYRDTTPRRCAIATRHDRTEQARDDRRTRTLHGLRSTPLAALRDRSRWQWTAPSDRRRSRPTAKDDFSELFLATWRRKCPSGIRPMKDSRARARLRQSPMMMTTLKATIWLLQVYSTEFKNCISSSYIAAQNIPMSQKVYRLSKRLLPACRHVHLRPNLMRRRQDKARTKVKDRATARRTF